MVEKEYGRPTGSPVLFLYSNNKFLPIDNVVFEYYDDMPSVDYILFFY